jgi:LEA14-like dessication related protein
VRALFQRRMRCGTARAVHSLAALLLALLASACSRPDPPTLVPERVQLKAFSTKQIDLDVVLDVTNPNTIDLVARNLTAHVIVGGQFDVGTIQIPVSTVFAAQHTTKLDVPLSVQVNDLAGLATLALTSPQIPYTVDGTVGLGGDLLHVEVPYKLSGSVPREVVVRAVSAAFPGLGLGH